MTGGSPTPPVTSTPRAATPPPATAAAPAQPPKPPNPAWAAGAGAVSDIGKMLAASLANQKVPQFQSANANFRPVSASFTAPVIEKPRTIYG